MRTEAAAAAFGLRVLGSCDVPKLQAEIVKTDAYDVHTETHGNPVMNPWRAIFGVCSVTLAATSFVGVKSIPGWAGTLNNVQDGGRTVVVGAVGMAEDVLDKQELAQVVTDLMSPTMEKIADDLNTISNDVRTCIQDMADNFREDMDRTRHAVRETMMKSDFSSQLRSSVSRSSHRASVVLELLHELNLQHQGDTASILIASPLTKRLTSTVSAGLHDCLDISGLVAQVSEDTISEVIASLGKVDEWFSSCKMFSRMAQALRPAGEVVPLYAHHRVEQILAREFVLFYKTAKITSVTSWAALVPLVERFELRAQNFLHLVTAEHYHAVNNLVFPQRQGAQHGLTESERGQYTRRYSVGVEHRWEETCRYCRKDGSHYGCWEEEAVSYKRCIASGGIHYRELLEDSNEYSCQQCNKGYTCFNYRGRYGRPEPVECGGRPQQ
jgi:hypothetical protein